MHDFSKVNILVIGDIMLDRYWSGATSRVSPEAPVPVVKINHHRECIGGAANVANNCLALGAKVSCMGLVGNDAEAQSIFEALSEKKITPILKHIDGYKTITKLRVLSRHQQLLRMDFEEPFQSQHAKQLTTELTSIINEFDAVILSDYGKGTLHRAADLIDICREAKVPVFIDPKGSDFDKYRGATVITPNFSEFTAIKGEVNGDDELQDSAQELRESLALEALLVTRSEKGLSLFRANEPALHLPANTREVYDVTGAGDTVIATLATAIASGIEWKQAIHLANTAAGIVVGKLGTATASVDELNDALDEPEVFSSGITTDVLVKTDIQRLQMNDKIIVMTNGCFDLLHPGHIDYLQRAKALGDYLIVAINDDDSVQRLKGKNRPINTLHNRMIMLAALECVDWVIPFAADTPAEIIKSLQPNVLVKGGDYSVDTIVGAKEVLSSGGQVEVLPFLAGMSSTNLIDRILKQHR